MDYPMPHRRILHWILSLFSGKKNIRLGIYGPPNTGKTSLANRIIADFVGSKGWVISPIPHETRKIQSMREIVLTSGGRSLTIDLFDMPGITTKKTLNSDYMHEFIFSMSEKEAEKRLEEAAEGVKQAISYMKKVDGAIVVLDATKDPYNKVNALILGVLKANNVKVIIAANKIDLEEANAERVRRVLSKYPVVDISCTKGTNIEKLYASILHNIR